MSQSRASKQRHTGAGGAKALLTASALAATLGGWAAFSAAEPAPAAEPTPAATVAAPTPRPELRLPPLPTLVPLPGAAVEAVVNPPAPALPTATPAPPLRVVAAPAAPAARPAPARPVPITRTRSSR